MYPDFIVATEVSSDLFRIFNWLGLSKDSLVTKEDVEKVVQRIVISPDGCAERQFNLLHEGLLGISIGFGDYTWQASDYEEYLEGSPILFKRDEDPYFYRLNKAITSMYSPDDTVESYVLKVNELLLVKKRYSDYIKKKYGV